MIGIIDIGNTFFHCGLFKSFELIKVKRTLSPLEVKNFFKKVKDILCISVVPSKKKLIEEVLEVELISFPSHLIQLSYSSKPGEDRLANGIGAMEVSGLPVIVVDCGSAITIDLFSDPDDSKFLVKFEGGAILPGLSLYFEAIYTAGALLPSISPQFVSSIGKTTEDCIKFGAYGCFVGGMKEILLRLDYKNKNLIFTGGDGNKFSSFFGAKYEPNLTLKGGVVAYNKLCS
ncbi:MAG: type III pantothenate kinase [candidate division WOR-3 bacterium]